MSGTPDHVLRNRAAWDQLAAHYAERAAGSWAAPEEEDLPATETLQRPFFGMQRFQWLGTDSVEFHIGHGDMIRLLRRCGFEVQDLTEIPPSPGATTRHPIASIEWARQWPCEEVWKAANRGDRHASPAPGSVRAGSPAPPSSPSPGGDQ